MSARDVLAAMRERAEAATDGPWSDILEYPEDDALLIRGADASYVGSVLYDGGDTPNAEFIAQARTDLPALVEALEAVVEAHQSTPNSTSALYPVPLCTCGHQYPCATVQAIETALEGR